MTGSEVRGTFGGLTEGGVRLHEFDDPVALDPVEDFLLEFIVEGPK